MRPSRVLLLALALGTIGTLTFSCINALRIDAWEFGHRTGVWAERCEQVADCAASFDQNATLESLPHYAKNGSYFRFDDHVSEAAVDSGVTRADATPAIHAIEFEGRDRLALPPNAESTFHLESGLVVVTQRNEEFMKISDLVLPADQLAKVTICAQVAQGSKLRFGWSQTKEFRPKSTFDVDVIPDGNFHTYVIDASTVLRRGLSAGDVVHTIFLRPSDVEGDRVALDYVRFESKVARYREERYGVGYETLGTEMRRVLYMVTDCALAWNVQVPDADPMLRFGTGALLADRPVKLRVRLESAGEESPLFSSIISMGNRWSDYEIDLSRWAGEQVSLAFEASSRTENVALWSNPVLRSAPHERFNVIVYLEDALRADHLSGYGYHRATAPVKEELAQQGVTFLNAFSQATKTRPSIPSLMTSLLPSATGVKGFFDVLGERYLTLAEVLHHQGFETASFVQNGNAGPYAGLHQGFGTVFDDEALAGPTETLLGDELYSWLDRSAKHNFFAYLHVMDPHGPYDAPGPHRHWYDGGRGALERSEFHDPEWVSEPTREGRRSLYDGEVHHNDRLFGEFLDRLRALDVLDHTLIVFLSDHGEFLGEHDLWVHHPPSLRPVIHVPLIMVYPPELPAGHRIGENVQVIDVMPTILDLAGIELAQPLFHGESLVGLIHGDDPAHWRRRIVISEEISIGAGYASAFYGKWHLLKSREACLVGPLPNTLFARLDRKLNYRFGIDVIPDRFYLRVLRRDDDGRERTSLLFLPDLYWRYRMDDFVTGIQASCTRTWRLVAGDRPHAIHYDSGVQERLRALGYVN